MKQQTAQDQAGKREHCLAIAIVSGVVIFCPGIAIAAAPVLTSVRRLILVLDVLLTVASRLSQASRAYLRYCSIFSRSAALFFDRPLAEALTALEAELTALHQFFQIRWPAAFTLRGNYS